MATTQVLAPPQATLDKTGTVSVRVASFPILMGALLVAGTFIGAVKNILDPDTWWHAAVGQQILATHAWPHADTYSWTAPGAPWIAYEWLGEVLMGAAGRLHGLWSETILLVVLTSILILLLFAYATLRCGNFKAAFVACTTIIPILATFFTLRPQLLGYIFLVSLLICLELFRKGHARALWPLPLLFLIWVNTHGSFVLGFLAIGSVWLAGQFELEAGGLVAERWTKPQSLRLAATLLASVLVLPLTPYGTRQAAYPLIMALSQPINVNNIQEWQPIGTDMFVGKLFLIGLILFFLAVLVLRPKLRLDEVALALFGVYAACVHIRFIFFFLVLFVPLWALILSRWIPNYDRGRDHPLLNAALIALIAVGIVHYFPKQEALNRMVRQDYPVDALNYLKLHPGPGHWLNEYRWGGFLIANPSPRPKVFIDGRADLYEYSGVMADYLDIVRLQPGAMRLLKEYDITGCLVHRDAPLATMLAAMPGWKRVYADNVAAIFVRQ